MSILIKGALLNKKQTDLCVEQNTITEIASSITHEADHKIDASSLALAPSFVNSHTHAAMTLFRGYADDMKLMEWLEQKIWPNEAKLTEKMVYAGAQLACLEMIKSGTTYFNDMYWHFKGSARALKDMKMRGCINGVFIDLFDEQKAKEQIKENQTLFSDFKDYNPLMQFGIGPHAIYTVSEESLQWAAEFSQKNSLPLHIHVSETEHEVNECIKKHGCRPVEYLDKIGFLSPHVIAAHCVWLNENEADLLAKHNVTVAHNPIANMKLSVGAAFPYPLLKKKGINITLGTDGTSSNNNLSMFDTMKTAALLQKHHTNDPTVLSAAECLDLATTNGYKSFGLDIGFREGAIADFTLLDLKDPALVPNHNLTSDLVYAANNSCVHSTICNGELLMSNRKVANEETIIEQASQAAHKLLG